MNSGNGGTSKSNMMVVGLSLGVLGMVYVLAVLIYLKLRRRILLKSSNRAAKNKLDGIAQEEGEGNMNSMDPAKRLDMYHTHSLNRKKAETGNEETSPWKPLSRNETYNRNWTDRPGQLGCEFSVQEFQLRPEHFEPEALASPPQPVVDYLQRLQTSMTYARHRLRMCYRYQPSLVGIPEDDYFYKENAEEGDDIDASVSKNFCCHSTIDTRSSGIRSTLSSMNPLHPKVPPRKSRRKSKCPEPATSGSSNFSQESSNGSETEEEKNQIKSAMDTLNDTLDAIEYDIFQQGLMSEKGESSDSPSSRSGKHQTNSETQTTDDELDIKDLDTSSCSSMSVVTVLARDAKFPPMNKLVFTESKSPVSPVNGFVSPSGKKSRDTSFESVSESNIKITKTSKRLVDFSTLGQKSQNLTQYALHCELFNGLNKDSTIFNTINSKCRSGYDTEVTEVTDTEVTELDYESAEVYTTKSSSAESVTTSMTDMTLDSLDSLGPTPEEVATATLIDLWITRLTKGSLGRCNKHHGRKKKKGVETKEKFEHVCSKRRDRCPVHDFSAGSALIDKLATYDNSKTKPGSDVTSYFQSLKQDVLREHLKGWLTTQSAMKNSKKSDKKKYHDSRPPSQGDKSLDTTLVSAVFNDSGFQSSRSSMSKTSELMNTNEQPTKLEEPLKSSTPKPTPDSQTINDSDVNLNNKSSVIGKT